MELKGHNFKFSGGCVVKNGKSRWPDCIKESMLFIDRLTDFLGTSDDQTTEEVKAELREQGIDIDNMLLRAKEIIYQLCEEQRMRNAVNSETVRMFNTGATRDTLEGKLDYEGFLSPRVLQIYAEYLHKHRLQSDGKKRDSDNWQQGIPKDVYIKSGLRHVMDVWLYHRNNNSTTENLKDSLCGVIFNFMGYLFELDKENKT